MQACSLSQGSSALVRNWKQGWNRSRPGVLHRSTLHVQAFTAQAEAPARASDVVAPSLHPSHAQLLQRQKGPLVKITAHYHVNFGDSLKVIGNTEEFGTWNAATAPNMIWGEDDVWSLVIPMAPGEHEFKVAVQLANGGLLWEDGSNRQVIVPEDTPLGTMLVAECTFNYAEMMAEPVLQPVSDDVLQLLESRAEAEMSAQIEAFAQDLQKQHVSEAAAAVAKALATLDAEAEETVRRSFISSDDECEQQTVSAANTVAIDSGTVAPSAGRAPALEGDGQAKTSTAPAEAEVAQAAQALSSEGSQPPAVKPTISPAASLHAKIAQDKPVAVGFVDNIAPADPAAASQKTSAPDESTSSSVVAAFMKSVAKKPLPQPQSEAPAATVTSVKPTDNTTSDAETDSGVGHDLAVQETPVIETAAEAVGSAAVEAIAEAQAAVGRDLAVQETPVIETAALGVASAADDAIAEAEAAVGPDLAVQETPVIETAAVAIASAAAAVDAIAESQAAVGPDLAVQETPVVEISAVAVASAADDAITVAVTAETAISPVSEDTAETTVSSVPDAIVKIAGSPSPDDVSPASTTQQGSRSTEAVTALPDDGVLSAASDSSSAVVPISSIMTSESTLSGRGRSAVPTPSSSPHGSRPPSPGRGSTHVAAATAAAAVHWMEGVKSNGVVAAAREAEEEARTKAARLAAAREAASAAATEAAKLNQDLHSSVNGRGNTSTSNNNETPRFRLGASFSAPAADANSGGVEAALPAPPDVVPAAQDKAYRMATASATAAVPGLTPPPVSSPSSRNSSPVKRAVLTTVANSADADRSVDGDRDGGMQFLSAVVGSAAVGTVLWSEFVLKETGCGLPPGPYGLLGAVEGLSYLAVLGFAGAGVAARGSSGGKQGLPGALAVPEMMAYGALAAGLLVLASQLHDYGYIPPPLPDAAVAPLPATDDLSAQLAAQLAALQAILSQLKSAASEGIDSLQLQQQLAQLQLQVDGFSTYVAAQATAVDSQLQSGLLQLQDSLASATNTVSTFVGTQLQQLDIPGKLAFVVDVLKKQEQQLVVELPKQFAELQKLAATATAMVQETALQAATATHLPELLASLDKSMGVLHDVLEFRIQQLDVVLTQLHDNCAAAASQLATAARAAHEAGLVEASAELAQLQALLADAMARVQDQVWSGYQQLALADHLSDMLLSIRTSAAELAASTTAEAEKLHLQQQLTELEAIAGSSVTALSSNAMDQLSKLELEQRLTEIEQQAAAAAVSLENGMVQQYQEQVPALQQQLGSLQDSIAGWAADAQRGVQQQNVEELLLELQHSMEATANAVREVAAASADSAGQQLHVASSSMSTQLEHMSSAVSHTIHSGSQNLGKAVGTATDAAKTAAHPVQQLATSVPATARQSASAIPQIIIPVEDLNGELAAWTPDIESVKQLWEADDFLAPGVDLRDASDVVKSIWANRPQ